MQLWTVGPVVRLSGWVADPAGIDAVGPEFPAFFLDENSPFQRDPHDEPVADRTDDTDRRADGLLRQCLESGPDDLVENLDPARARIDPGGFAATQIEEVDAQPSGDRPGVTLIREPAGSGNRRLANASLALAAGFLALALLSGMPFLDILSHIGAGATVLVIAFGCFAMGWIGGGDAKLAAATALWIGLMLLFYMLLPQQIETDWDWQSLLLAADQEWRWLEIARPDHTDTVETLVLSGPVRLRRGRLNSRLSVVMDDGSRAKLLERLGFDRGVDVSDDRS